MNTLKLLEKLYNENSLEKDELLWIIKYITDEHKNILFEYSDKTRNKYYGKKVYMRGLIEFTNYCKQNCLYCGVRGANSNVDRYRLSKDEILSCCEEGYSLGYRTFVLQGGEDPWFTRERVVDIVSSIKDAFKDVAVTLSIGERSYEDYKAFFDAGADRYLLRHETASKELYKSLHPGMDFDNRINCLNTLKKIGYQVGAGFMVGLPGQRAEDFVEDLLFLKEFKPDMIGIGPFIAHSETPLKGEKGGTVEETLILLALTRLLVPQALMPATTAMGTLDSKGRERAIKAGANVVMPNLSPLAVREKYEIYEGKICTGDEAAHCRKCIEGRIRSAGYEADMGRGDSYKYVMEHNN